MIAYLVSVLLLPVFSRMTVEKDPQLGSVTRMITSLMLVFSVTAATAFSFHSDTFMYLLWHSQPASTVNNYAQVFTILVWGIVPIAMTYVFGTLLTAAGHLRQLNILAASTLLINIAINLALIPRYGAQGSAWAALAAQSFMAITQIVEALRRLHLKPSVGYLLRLLLFSAVITTAMALLPPLSWWVTLLVAAGTALLAALLLRLIDLKQMLLIVTNN